MAVLVLPVLAMLLATQDETARRVQDLVRQLRSERIEERGAVDAELRKLGRDALPLIDAAASDADPDVALRLRRNATTMRLPGAADALRRIERVLLDASAVRMDVHLETRTLGREST